MWLKTNICSPWLGPNPVRWSFFLYLVLGWVCANRMLVLDTRIDRLSSMPTSEEDEEFMAAACGGTVEQRAAGSTRETIRDARTNFHLLDLHIT